MQHQILSNLIAQTALDHYFKVLPTNKAKPQPGQWTVYAAIVATKNLIKQKQNDVVTKKLVDENQLDAWVVSCATGSKCTTIQPALNHFGIEHIPQCVDADSNNADSNADSNADVEEWKSQRSHCEEKCCSSQVNGFVVHDSHAEVMARRGLVKVLWEEILYNLKNHEKSNNHHHNHEKTLLRLHQKHCVDDIVDDVDTKSEEKWIFEMRNDVKLHLYVSDSPCGDASIYDIAQRYASTTNQNKESKSGSTYTGAKIILSNEEGKAKNDDNFFECIHTVQNTNGQQSEEMNHTTTSTTTTTTHTTRTTNTTSNTNTNTTTSQVNIAREKVQIKAALRLKSGRSDIPTHLRSSSMSCSDKICKWIVLGLQGCGVLARFIPNGVHFSSIVVSRDPRIDEKESHNNNNSDVDRLSDMNNTQLNALNRALIVRAKETIEALEIKIRQNNVDASSLQSSLQSYLHNLQMPSIHICNQIFPVGKVEMEKQHMDKKADEEGCEGFSAIPIQTISNSGHKKRALSMNNLNESSSSLLSSKSKSRKRQKGMKISPCGISLNWQCPLLPNSNERKSGNDIEQLVGAKGILQRKKPKCLNDVIKSVSRLSRHSLNCLAMEALQLTGVIDVCSNDVRSDKTSYQRSKEVHAPATLRTLMKLVQKDCNNPLQGWVKSSTEYDFSLCFQIKLGAQQYTTS